MQKCKWLQGGETRFPKVSPKTQATGRRLRWELTVHKLCADRDPVLHKKGTEESDDVRRVALQSGQKADRSQKKKQFGSAAQKKCLNKSSFIPLFEEKKAMYRPGPVGILFI